MELNIVSTDIDLSFNEQIGITEERSDELSDQLDAIVKKYKGHTVRTCDVFADICEICNNKEELIYCTINHCNFMAKNYGLLYCPPQKKNNERTKNE